MESKEIPVEIRKFVRDFYNSIILNKLNKITDDLFYIRQVYDHKDELPTNLSNELECIRESQDYLKKEIDETKKELSSIMIFLKKNFSKKRQNK